MKRFEFRLQRTMDWRQVQRDSEKTQLERLHGERAQLSESRSSVQGELEDMSTGHAASRACSAEELHRQAMFTRSLFNLDRQLAGEEARCSADIEKQMQRCVEADRAHKLLEKLRDAGHRRWVAECDRETENTATDTWNAVNRRASQSGNDGEKS